MKLYSLRTGSKNGGSSRRVLKEYSRKSKDDVGAGGEAVMVSNVCVAMDLEDVVEALMT